jgi:GntR family transcriptional regulator, transcriptional repressor for pyruvate dehydrogenase complex
MGGSPGQRGASGDEGGLGSPLERQHASDHVFRQLASAILRRQLPPGAMLPPERELAERFGVSRIVVREAIHRLKEYELVRVRQGSPTQVLDPDEATDIRLLGLEIDLMREDDQEGVQSLTERQRYAGAAVLALAEQRIAEGELDELEQRIREYESLADRKAEELAFERDVWVAFARGSRNRIYLRETLWFFNLLAREPRFYEAVFPDSEGRIPLYKSIVALMRTRRGAADAYLEGIRREDERSSG